MSEIPGESSITEVQLGLENKPTKDQRDRLEWTLGLLKVALKEYGMAVQVFDGDVAIVDDTAGTILALGITYMVGTKDVTVAATDSILDGVWPVMRNGELVEQREVRSET